MEQKLQYFLMQGLWSIEFRELKTHWEFLSDRAERKTITLSQSSFPTSIKYNLLEIKKKKNEYGKI